VQAVQVPVVVHEGKAFASSAGPDQARGRLANGVDIPLQLNALTRSLRSVCIVLAPVGGSAALVSDGLARELLRSTLAQGRRRDET